MIRITSDYRSLSKELNRLSKVPAITAKKMDAAFYKGYGATQGLVHVVTGSLKSSGKASTEFDGEDWKGEISYGGVSLGVNNPVTYAIYEKARGEDHDWMVPLKALDQQMASIIEESLKG